MCTRRRFVLTSLSLGICIMVIVNVVDIIGDWDIRRFSILVGGALRLNREVPTTTTTIDPQAAIIAAEMEAIDVYKKNASFSDHRAIRVLCWIMTAPEFLWTRSIHVRNTWGRSCNVLLFASDYKDELFSTINITVPHGREYLPTKTFKTFDYIYKTRLNDSEWFFKADDDTYTYMDNMRGFLNNYDSNAPMYIGYQWLLYTKQGYPSGGAGYILSREALKRFANRPAGRCSSANGDEDVKMGLCMAKLGVKAVSTELLNAFAPGNYSNIANDTITLHYVPPEWMYQLHEKENRSRK